MKTRLTASFLQSVRNAFRLPFSPYAPRGVSDFRYLSLHAHPDDEVLTAGTINRLIRYSQDFECIYLTDGNGNTSANRVDELQASYRSMGYRKEVRCLIPETELIGLLQTPQGASPKVSDERIEEAANILERQIDIIAQQMILSGTNVLLTHDYSGGHFIHDITHIVGVLATHRASRLTGNTLRAYEFPAYFLKLNVSQHVKPEDVQEIIGKVRAQDKAGVKRKLEFLTHEPLPDKVDLSKFMTLGVGKYLDHFESKEGLTDPALGINHGILRLTPYETYLKLKIKRIHKSQQRSMGRLLGNATSLGNFSEEYLREVPRRDYTRLPSTNMLLYEVIPWRAHAEFDTFRRLYLELASLAK